jgi:hypothetical protein
MEVITLTECRKDMPTDFEANPRLVFLVQI